MKPNQIALLTHFDFDVSSLRRAEISPLFLDPVAPFTLSCPSIRRWEVEKKMREKKMEGKGIKLNQPPFYKNGQLCHVPAESTVSPVKDEGFESVSAFMRGRHSF